MSQLPPKRLPLVATPTNRAQSTDKDAKLINGYVEKGAMDELWCYKRPGLAVSETYTGAVGVGNGVFNWEGIILAVFGTRFYENGVYKGAVTDTNGSPYDFSANLAATESVFIHSPLISYTWNGTTLAQVVDVDYPATTVRGAVYIDGTTYVMTPEAYIFGSALNDPTSWSSLNVIRAQIEPDAGVAIAKQLNYLIAFKTTSVEVFYDAANTAGSPLGRVESAKLSIGCASGKSVADSNGALLWMGASRNGGYNVMLMEGLKARVVSTPEIERLLGNSGSQASAANGVAVQVAGHRFYVLSFSTASGTINMAYDIGQDLWSEWKISGGGSFINCATRSLGTDPFVQRSSSAVLYTLNAGTYLDAGLGIKWDLYTPNYDAGTKFRKTCSLLEVTADQRTGNFLLVRKSDDDYQTWTQFRTLNLGLARSKLPNWGTFIRRAHHFHHDANAPLRVKAVDLHLDLGTL